MATKYIASNISYSAVQDFVLSDIPVGFVNQYQNTLGIKKLVYNNNNFELSDQDIEYTIEDGIITILNPESTDYYVYKNVSELLVTKDNEILQTLNEARDGISLVKEDIAADYIVACKLIPSSLSSTEITIPSGLPGIINDDKTCELWSDFGETQFATSTIKTVYNQAEYNTPALTQQSINDAYKAGGGTVVITESDTNAEDNIILQNGVSIYGNGLIPNSFKLYGNDIDNSVVIKNVSFSDAVINLQSCNTIFENCSFTGDLNTAFSNIVFKNCSFNLTNISDISGISNYEFINCSFSAELTTIKVPNAKFTRCSETWKLNNINVSNELIIDSAKFDSDIELKKISAKNITIQNTVVFSSLLNINTTPNIEASESVKIDCSYFNSDKNSVLYIKAPDVAITNSAFLPTVAWDPVETNTNRQKFTAVQATGKFKILKDADNYYSFFNSCAILNDKNDPCYTVKTVNGIQVADVKYSNLINSYIFDSGTTDIFYDAIGNKSTGTYDQYGNYVIVSSEVADFKRFSGKTDWESFLNGSIEYFNYGSDKDGKSVSEINQLFKGDTWNLPYPLPTTDILGTSRGDLSKIGPALLNAETISISPKDYTTENGFYYFAGEPATSENYIILSCNFSSSTAPLTFYKSRNGIETTEVITPIEIENNKDYVFDAYSLFKDADEIVRIYVKFTIDGIEYYTNSLDFVNIQNGIYIGDATTSTETNYGISPDSPLPYANWETILYGPKGIFANLETYVNTMNNGPLAGNGTLEARKQAVIARRNIKLFFKSGTVYNLTSVSGSEIFDKIVGNVTFTTDSEEKAQLNLGVSNPGLGINLGGNPGKIRNIVLSNLILNGNNSTIIWDNTNVIFSIDNCNLVNTNINYNDKDDSSTNYYSKGWKFTNSYFVNCQTVFNSTSKDNFPKQYKSGVTEYSDNQEADCVFYYKNCRFSNFSYTANSNGIRFQDCYFFNNSKLTYSKVFGNANTCDFKTRSIIRCRFVNSELNVQSLNPVVVNSSIYDCTFNGSYVPGMVFCSISQCSYTATTKNKVYGEFNAVNNNNFDIISLGNKTSNFQLPYLFINSGTEGLIYGNSYINAPSRIKVVDYQDNLNFLKYKDNVYYSDLDIGIDGVKRDDWTKTDTIIDCGAMPMKIYYVSKSKGSDSNSGTSWTDSFVSIRQALNAATNTFGCIFIEKGSYNTEYTIGKNVDDYQSADTFITEMGEQYFIITRNNKYYIDLNITINNWWEAAKTPDTLELKEIIENDTDSEFKYKISGTDIIGNLISIRDNPLQLGSNICIIGGFDGTEPLRQKTKNSSASTIIYGSYNTEIYKDDNVLLNKQNSQFCTLYDTILDTEVGQNCNNPYTLLYHNGSNSIIENITFKGGCANNYPALKAAINKDNIDSYINSGHNFGGAIQGLIPGLKLKNCSFENNESYYQGPAIAALGVDAETNLGDNIFELENCTFKNNKSIKHGGTVFANGDLALTINNCNFNNNVAIENGAAVYIASGKAEFNAAGEITISEVYTDYARAVIKNSVFFNNCAKRGIIYTRHNGFTGYSNIFGKNFLTLDNGTVIEVTETKSEYTSNNSTISNSLFYYNRNNKTISPISIKTSGANGNPYSSKIILNNNLLYSSAGLYNPNVSYSNLEYSETDSRIKAVCNERKLLNNKFDNILNIRLINNFVPYISNVANTLITSEIPAVLESITDHVSIPETYNFNISSWNDWANVVSDIKTIAAAKAIGLREAEFIINISNNIDYKDGIDSSIGNPFNISSFGFGGNNPYDLSEVLGDFYFIGNGYKMTTSELSERNYNEGDKPDYGAKVFGHDRHFIGLFPKTDTPRRFIFDQINFEYGYSDDTNSIRPYDVYGAEFSDESSGSYGTSCLFGYVDTFFNKCSFSNCANAIGTNDGATLFLYQGHNYLNQCKFEDNYVDSNGGCVYNKGSIYSSGSTFRRADNNRATVSMFNCFCNNNTITQNGMVLYSNAAQEAICTYCKFSNNRTLQFLTKDFQGGNHGTGGTINLKVCDNNIFYNNIFIDNRHVDEYTLPDGSRYFPYENYWINAAGVKQDNAYDNSPNGSYGTMGEIIRVCYNIRDVNGTEGDVSSLYCFNNTIKQNERPFRNWFYFDPGVKQTINGTQTDYKILDKRIHNNLLLSTTGNNVDYNQYEESDGNYTFEPSATDIETTYTVNAQTVWSYLSYDVDKYADIKTTLYSGLDSALFNRVYKLPYASNIIGASTNPRKLPVDNPLFDSTNGTAYKLNTEKLIIDAIILDIAAILAKLPIIDPSKYWNSSEIVLSPEYYNSIIAIINGILQERISGIYSTKTYNDNDLTDSVEYTWFIDETIVNGSTRFLRYTISSSDNNKKIKCIVSDGINNVELQEITLKIASPIIAYYNQESIVEFETKATELSVSIIDATNDILSRCTYLWSVDTSKSNTSYSTNSLSDNTDISLSLEDLELNDAGYYKCIITYTPNGFVKGRSFTAKQNSNFSIEFIDLIVYAAVKINNELTTTGAPIEGDSEKGELRLRIGDTLHLHTELLQGWEPRFEWQKSTNGGETWSSLATLPLVDCKANIDYEEVQTSRINDNALYRAHVANFYPGTNTIGTEDYSSPVVFLRVLRAAKTGDEITSNIVLCKIPFGELLKNNIRIDKKFMVFTSAQNKDLYNNPIDAENSTPTLHKRNPESLWIKDSTGTLKQNYTQFSFPTDLDIDKKSGQYGIAADEKERKVYILDLQNLNYDKANHINTPLLEINIPNYIGNQVGNNYVFERLGFTVYMHDDFIAVSDPYAWKSNNDGDNTIKYTGRVFLFKYFKGSNSVRLLNIMQSPNETENGSYGDDIEFDNYGNILISAPEELQEVQIGYNLNIDGSISPAVNAANKLTFHTKGKVYVYSIADIEKSADVLKLITPKQVLSSQYIPGSIDYNKGDWGVLKTKYYSQSKYFIRDAFGGKRINEGFVDYASYVEYYNFNYKYDFTYKAQFPTMYTEADFRQGNSLGAKIEYGIQYSFYTNNTDELFGSCMSITNDCLLIGAPFYNQNQGYVELWKFVKTSDNSNEGKYVYNTNVQNINPNKLTCFGQNVEMGENFFLVGYKSGVQIQGVNLFDYSTGKVINNNIEIAPSVTRAASFGNSLDSYGNTFLVASPEEGKIYRYSYTPVSNTATSNIKQLQLIDLERQASVIEFGSKLVMVNDKILASYKSYGSEETVYGEKIVSMGEGAVLQYTLIGGDFRLL